MSRDAGLELWNNLYSSWDPEYQAALEFLLVAPDPDRLEDALRIARRLLYPARMTESGPEHLDEPVDDLDESVARLTNGDSFFINLAGEIDGIAVTISVGTDNIVLKFAGGDMFTEGQDGAREPRAFRTLTDAALELAEVSRATEVRFGNEGVEVAPAEGIRIWERDEPAESGHSSGATMLFDEYVRTLDERFRRKKYEIAYEPADGFARMYHRRARFPLRGDTFYFLGLTSEGAQLATIDHRKRRAVGLAERHSTKPGFGLQRWHKLVIVFAMENVSSETIASVRDDGFAAMFREAVLLVADLSERRLHDAGFWNWIGTFGVQQLARRRMLAFK